MKGKEKRSVKIVIKEYYCERKRVIFYHNM